MIKILSILSTKSINPFSQFRCLSQTVTIPKENSDGKMLAWQINCYTTLNYPDLYKVRIPMISNPSQLLVKVDASSVNPIDIAMTKGYGSKVFNLIRKATSFNGETCSDIEFPLTLGRDFTGTIVSKGHAVNNFKLGDEIWGIVPIQGQGCHAHYVVVDSTLVNLRPKNLSHIEAAGILYAGLTAWSSLWYTGGLFYKLPSPNKIRVLVLGGSGGVGTMAIQLLKAWKIEVVTTCKSDATTLLQNLGADLTIDYEENSVDSKIIAAGPYDIILDCCNQGSNQVKLKRYPYSNYITLNSPLLQNIDEHGFLFGTFKNITDFIHQNIPTNLEPSIVKWGYLIPSQDGLHTIQKFVENKQIVPVIDEVFPFEELQNAYIKMQKGHLRGKIIIDMRS